MTAVTLRDPATGATYTVDDLDLRVVVDVHPSPRTANERPAPQVTVFPQTTPGTVSALTVANVGSAVQTVNPSSAPDAAVEVIVVFTAGGTVGSPGAFYRVFVNGVGSGGSVALGTATQITVRGVRVDLGTGTLLAGQSFAFTTTAPQTGLEDAVKLAKQSEQNNRRGSWVDAWVSTMTIRDILATYSTTQRPKFLTNAEYSAALPPAAPQLYRVQSWETPGVGWFNRSGAYSSEAAALAALALLPPGTHRVILDVQ